MRILTNIRDLIQDSKSCIGPTLYYNQIYLLIEMIRCSLLLKIICVQFFLVCSHLFFLRWSATTIDMCNCMGILFVIETAEKQFLLRVIWSKWVIIWKVGRWRRKNNRYISFFYSFNKYTLVVVNILGHSDVLFKFNICLPPIILPCRLETI